MILAATWLPALSALAVGGRMIGERVGLVTAGWLVSGVVDTVETGIRGHESVRARFATDDGRAMIGRDLHKTQCLMTSEPGAFVR